MIGMRPAAALGADLVPDPDSDAPPPVATGAWVMGGCSVAVQVVALLDRGTTELNAGTPISMVLGALIVGWFSSGVVRGRTGRTVVVAFLVTLMLLASAADVERPLDVVNLALVIGVLAGLLAVRFSSVTAWWRAHPRAGRGPLRTVLLLAVLTGALGGLVAPAESGMFLSGRF